MRAARRALGAALVLWALVGAQHRVGASMAVHRPSWSSWQRYRVTGYCQGYRTAMGTLARWGEVAVDPYLIRLGSTVQIRGLGQFSAEDTGSDIQGHWLDVYTTCANAYHITGWYSARYTR